MTEYTFQLFECRIILGKNICFNSIDVLDNSILLSIDYINYKLYPNNDYYLALVYFRLVAVDVLASTIVLDVSECQTGYKLINGECIRYIVTPIGNLTEGEIYAILIVTTLLFGVSDILLSIIPNKK